ncbi:YybH family protein [Nocardiopsis lucentensis]|uniref:YybH family protein n=1 Tax=Nocardiopsis lucentensis TaxID=53441 RepID=UPI00034B7F38|nr:SgcJ/EcaC family oxidoreductase [Nocardiopsis lucentensis]
MNERDTQEIRDLLAAHTRLWIDHEMDAWGEYFTEDADFVTHRGLWWRSRRENVEGHEDVPASVLGQKANYSQEVVSVQGIAPGVALVHTLWTWPGHRLPAGGEPEDRRGVITYVLVRRGAGWRIRAAHNTRVNGLADFGPTPDRGGQAGAVRG